MADNKQAGAAVGSGPTFATDEIDGVDYPRAKIVWGVDGTATDASASNPLPVVQTGTPALPTGAATAAKQDTEITHLATLAGAVAGTEIQADVLTLPNVTLAAGTNTNEVVGDAAHDAAAAGNPLLQGGYASAAAPTDVSADGDAVRAWHLRNGAQAVNLTAAGALIPGDATNGLKVQVATSALPTGAATAAKQPALGTAGSPSTDVLTVQGSASGTALPVSLASVPSHAVTNAGTFVTQENGAALTALQLIDDVVLAEDAAHSSGDKGIMALAVRKDSAASLAGTDGDYIPLTTDSTGALRVTGGGGGTQYAEDAAHSSGDTGTLSLAVRRDANTSLVDATGDYAPLQVDSSGNLKVAIISGAGSGGTSATDDAAFSVASGSGTPIMGLADETSPDAVDEGDVGVVRMTLSRALHVNLRDASGNELAAGNQYAEDAAHTTGDLGTVALVVRKDTAAQVAGTDGDYSILTNDASGRLHVNVGALPSGTVAGGSSLPAGSNNIGDVDVLTVPADPFGANADAASATGSISAKLRFIASTGIPVTGTVTVGSHAVTNAGTFAVQAGQAAHDAAVSGNPVRIAGRAGTSAYTAVADGDTADLLTTILGKLVTQPFCLPGQAWSYVGAAGGLVNTTAVTIKTAAGAGIKNYITSITLVNSHQTTGTEVVINDGAAGTAIFRTWCQPAGGGVTIQCVPPLAGTANTLLEIKEISATGTAGVVAQIMGYSAAE